MLVNRVDQVAAPGGLVAQVQDFSPPTSVSCAEQQAAGAGADDVDEFRAVAPPVMSFAAGPQALKHPASRATCRSLAR